MARMLALLLAAAGTGLVEGVGVFRAGAQGFVQSLEFKHRLRVCNAYPYTAPLDVFRSTEQLTDVPMPYKSCKDFTAPLKAGDKLEFKVGGASAGTFSVSDLPNNDAVLLLVIHRHDQLSTAVSFESHVFANLLNAQVAIIDTYKGTEMAFPRIRDFASKDTKEQVRSEELRYSSVVAVNPGRYEVKLEGSDGKVKAAKELVALNHESYVILRIGVDSKSGPAYPQDLIVFPNSDPHLLHNGAVAHGALLALLAAAASAFA